MKKGKTDDERFMQMIKKIRAVYENDKEFMEYLKNKEKKENA